MYLWKIGNTKVLRSILGGSTLNVVEVYGVFRAEPDSASDNKGSQWYPMV